MTQVEELGLRLNSVAVRITRLARSADKDLAVPPAQLSALSVLVFGGRRTIAQLSATEGVSSPTMTRIVDGLERAGAARRRPHPDDSRAVLVEATSKGRRLMEAGRRNRAVVLARLLQRLDPADRGTLARGLDLLETALALDGGGSTARP